MPRFYFHLYNDITSLDDEGQEYDNLPIAHQKAVAAAREMAAEAVKNGHLTLSHRIEIADEAGEIVGTVWFRDILDIKE